MACKCNSIHNKKVVPHLYSAAGTHIRQGGAALPLLSMGSNSEKLLTRRPTCPNLPLGSLAVPLALSPCFQLSLEKWYAHS